MADNSRRDIERGRIAQDILDNEIFQEAMEMLEDEYKKIWAATKSHAARSHSWKNDHCGAASHFCRLP